MKLRCMICGLDPATETKPAAIYRLNDKGQPGVFACRAHYAQAKARHFPDDDPEAPPPTGIPIAFEKPLGPWTGGVTPVGGTLQ